MLPPHSPGSAAHAPKLSTAPLIALLTTPVDTVNVHIHKQELCHKQARKHSGVPAGVAQKDSRVCVSLCVMTALRLRDHRAEGRDARCSWGRSAGSARWSAVWTRFAPGSTGPGSGPGTACRPARCRGRVERAQGLEGSIPWVRWSWIRSRHSVPSCAVAARGRGGGAEGFGGFSGQAAGGRLAAR